MSSEGVNRGEILGRPGVIVIVTITIVQVIVIDGTECNSNCNRK